MLTGLAVMVALIIRFRVSSGNEFFVSWIKVMALYSGALVFIVIIKHMIRLNEKLEAAQIHLVEKNMDLSHAYEQLKRAYDDLEDYTIMKERTNMSREMHDTVGHALTTSLVELELCKMLVKDPEEVKAISYGANGYLYKDIPYDKLAHCIREVYEGQFIMPQKVADVLAKNIGEGNKPKEENTVDFTEREMQIVEMIKDGFNNKQIAKALYIMEDILLPYPPKKESTWLQELFLKICLRWLR